MGKDVGFNLLAEITKAEEVGSQAGEGEISKSGGRIVEGYATVETIDSVGDIIELEGIKEGFAEYMKNPIVRWQHKDGEVIGKVLEGRFDDRGLFVRVQLARNVSKAEEVWELIKQGIVKAFSIGYRVNPKDIVYEERDGQVIRKIKKALVKEVSIVDIPANPAAWIVNVRKSLEEAINMVEQDNEVLVKAEYVSGAWNPPSSEKERRKLLEKCGSKAFLLPDELKFPVMTSSCKYNINGVRAAIVRAAQHGYKQVEEKARRLLERLTGKKDKSLDEFINLLKASEGEAYILEEVDSMAEEVKKQEVVEEEKKFIVREDGKVKHISEVEKEKEEEGKKGGKKKSKEIKKAEGEDVSEENKEESQPEEVSQESEEEPKVEENKEASEEVDLVKKIEELLDKKLAELKKSEVSGEEEKSENDDLETKSAGELLMKILKE